MNLPTWLLIFFFTVAAMCLEISYNIMFSLLTYPETSSCYHSSAQSAVKTQYLAFTITTTMFSVIYPFNGWLADTVIGREKAINLSLWSCWFGTLLQCISYCIQYGTCGLPVNIAKYGISGVAFLLLTIGVAVLFTNIPAYGLDQLIDKSNTHARAFIHWIVWGLFVGFLTEYVGFVKNSLFHAELLQITGIIVFTFVSLALLVHTWFYNDYEMVGIQKNNPYKMIYNVLNYAWHHKAPEMRSALTYWDNKIPSRINFGEKSYGGPFSEEDVENVKTFWRIVAVLLCTFGFFIPYYHTVIGVLNYMNTFKGATTTFSGYGSFVLFLGWDSQIILYVPLLELVIIPLFPKIEYFILNPLRGLGFSYLLILAALVCMIVYT